MKNAIDWAVVEESTSNDIEDYFHSESHSDKAILETDFQIF
jgi:hypothetical protein